MSLSRKRCGLGRRAALAGAAGLLASPAIARAQGSRGVALVIGNSKYHWETSLPNVKRDAPDIAKRFQALGLRTDLLQDANRDALLAAMEKFSAVARGANLAAFFYAGHGASWEKNTYLVPIDTDLGNPKVVPSLVSSSSVAGAMQEAANRLLVFDSCRNNPADGWRQLAARRDAINLEQQRLLEGQAANTLVLYSTSPGRVALDGPSGENSPFAAALLRLLGEPSIDLRGLAPKLRRQLLIATEGRQVLWDQNTYEKSFRLDQSVKSQVTVGNSADPSRIIELNNAYAFARDNGLPLPSGLIAYRSPLNSPHVHKIGSFKAWITTTLGPTQTLFLILSVDEQGTAEIITTVRNDQGLIWRLATGQAAENRLEFVPDHAKPNLVFDWRDANSGSLIQMPSHENPTAKMQRTQFTRLD